MYLHGLSTLKDLGRVLRSTGWALKPWRVCSNLVMLMSTHLVKSVVMVAGDGGCVVDCEVDGAMVVIYMYMMCA